MTGAPINVRTWPSCSTNPHLLPRGRIVMVTMEVCLPNAATRQDVLEWLALHMGCGTMGADNPLGHFEPEAFRGLDVQDTGEDSNVHEAREDVMAKIGGGA